MTCAEIYKLELAVLRTTGSPEKESVIRAGVPVDFLLLNRRTLQIVKS